MSLRMSKLIYITNTSVDGYIEDETGDFNWLNSDQIFEFITDLIRPMGTYLYGRRLYEKMVYWDAPVESYPPEHRDFATVWQKAQKIVYSRTLTDASARNTRFEQDFNIDAIQKLKRESLHDITIGGAELAALALEANLVDECYLFVHPIVVGGGKPAFRPGLRRRLDLLETHPFSNGVIHVRYRIQGGSS